jgi:hypothetical protein
VTETPEAAWRSNLVGRIDDAICIAMKLRSADQSSEPNKAMLEVTLSVLAGCQAEGDKVPLATS